MSRVHPPSLSSLPSSLSSLEPALVSASSIDGSGLRAAARPTAAAVASWPPAARPATRRRTDPVLVLGAALLALAALLAAAPADAEDPTSGAIPLDRELYRGLEDAYGMVYVEEDGVGGLHFFVNLDSEATGDEARIRRVYLSMEDPPPGLEAVPDDPDAVEMQIDASRYAWIRAGATLGTVVTMRPTLMHSRIHWRWWRSRVRWFRRPTPLQEVGFTLRADEPLVLEDVLGMTATWGDQVTQIGVQVFGAELGRRWRAPGLLGGVFVPDEPASPPDGGGGLPGGDGWVPSPDGTIPPGCLGAEDPVTGEAVELNSLIGLDAYSGRWLRCER